MWGGSARKSNEYSFCQPSETQRTSKTYKTSKAYKPSKTHKTSKTYKTSNIQIDQYSAASSLCGFTTLFELSQKKIKNFQKIDRKTVLALIWLLV